MASKKRKQAAQAGASTRTRKRAPLYGEWASSYAETVAARTGRLPTAAEVDKDPTFRAAVDKLIHAGPRTSHTKDSRLARAMETIGLRSPDWARGPGGDVGQTPTQRAVKWHKSRAAKARAAIKRGERLEDRAIQREFERAMMAPPKRKRPKKAKRAPVAKRQTTRKKQRPARKGARRRK